MASNVEIITNLYQLFANKDSEGIRHLFGEAIEWTQMEGFPNGGHYIGADQIFTHVFGTFSKDWLEWKAVVTEYLDAGSSVVAIGYYEGVYTATQRHVKADFAHWYTLHNGTIQRFKQYTDTHLIAQAMGVTPQ